MDAALAAIDAAFDVSATHETFKRRVRSAMRHPNNDPAIAARYRAHRDLLRLSIGSAVAVAQANLCMERDLLRRAPHSPRLSVMIAAELALLLRHLRRFDPQAWEALREHTEGGLLQAAE